MGLLCLRIFMSKVSCLLDNTSQLYREVREGGVKHFRVTMKTEEDRERKQRMEKERKR